MEQMWTSLVSIATAIVGVAILAVLVSKNSATSQVIGSAGDAFSKSLGVAVSPITGGKFNFSTGTTGSNNNFSVF